MGNGQELSFLLQIIWAAIPIAVYSTPLYVEEKNASSVSPVIYLLINLSDGESELLSKYLSEKKYATLKEMIDQKKTNLELVNYNTLEGENVPGFGTNFYDENVDTFNGSLNLTQEQLVLAEAYQNASIYNIIRALWNNKVEQELPEIDQYAILEYYNEKLAEKAAQQSIIVWLWNLIRGLFANSNDRYLCNANEPKCVRILIDRCNAEERQRLEQASDNDDPIQISDIIKQKLEQDPNLYMEYDMWNRDNDVPEALKDITHGLSQAQKRAMEKLRRLELTDKIKDFYRDKIEKRTLPQQEVIEEFFQRMNKTFARCYNPSHVKHVERQNFQ